MCKNLEKPLQKLLPARNIYSSDLQKIRMVSVVPAKRNQDVGRFAPIAWRNQW
jgi:hypothetical protein